MLPAGRYFIGDPCYVLDNNSGSDLNEDWSECCNLFITRKDNDFGLESFHSCLNGEYQLKSGHVFAIHGTQWGDGSYEGSDGFRYAVDSGTIGCVQLKPNELEGDAFRSDLGTIVEFQRPFNTFADNDGNIHIGHITIATGDTASDEDEEEESYPRHLRDRMPG